MLIHCFRYLAALVVTVVFSATPSHAQGESALFSIFGDPRADIPVVTLSLSDEVTAAADVASFTVSVSSDAETAEAAMRANAATTTAVIAALRASGLNDNEFVADSVNVTQRRGGRNSSVRGYTAYHAIRVETASVDRAGLMLAAAVAAGATQAEGPAFTRKETASLLSPLRARLYAQALQQATDYARAGGYARVRPAAISERVINRTMRGEMYAMEEMAAAAADMAVDAAEMATEMAPPTVSTSVRIGLQVSFTFRAER